MTECEDSFMAYTDVVIFAQSDAYIDAAEMLGEKLNKRVVRGFPDVKSRQLSLIFDDNGLSLSGSGQVLHGDFTQMLRRIRRSNLERELIVRAARIKGFEGVPRAVDATAGLGEDSFLLAAAGFSVQLYERDPIIAALLQDALKRASADTLTAEAAARMRLIEGDSIKALGAINETPDIVVLDPMFPARRKSALIGKKFQLLQQLEQPCTDEKELLEAAIASLARKIVIKRPGNGAFLAGHKPDYSLNGNTVRYDIVLPR